MDSLAPLVAMPSLSGQAYHALKEAILSLELRPGEVVATGRLADWLGVSRTPVHDALLRLEKEGLVTVLPQRGARVMSISRKDVDEIYELLMVLEGYAARVGALLFTRADDARATAFLTGEEEAYRCGDRLRASDQGRGLHDLVVGKVKNRRLSAYYLNSLTLQYCRIRRFAIAIPGRFERSHYEHMEILDSLRARDADRAGALMTSHLTSVRDSLLAFVESWQGGLDAELDKR